MKTTDIAPGSLVQFGPHHAWAGAVAIVEKVHPWGVDAYVVVPRQGAAPIKATLDDVSKVGESKYQLKQEEGKQ